jgi:hypothetical protein
MVPHTLESPESAEEVPPSPEDDPDPPLDPDPLLDPEAPPDPEPPLDCDPPLDEAAASFPEPASPPAFVVTELPQPAAKPHAASESDRKAPERLIMAFLHRARDALFLLWPMAGRKRPLHKPRLAGTLRHRGVRSSAGWIFAVDASVRGVPSRTVVSWEAGRASG